MMTDTGTSNTSSLKERAETSRTRLGDARMREIAATLEEVFARHKPAFDKLKQDAETLHRERRELVEAISDRAMKRSVGG